MKLLLGQEKFLSSWYIVFHFTFLGKYGKYTTNDLVGNVATNHISIEIKLMFTMKIEEALTMYTISKECWPQKSDGDVHGARHKKTWELYLSPVQVLLSRFGACQLI